VDGGDPYLDNANNAKGDTHHHLEIILNWFADLERALGR